VQKPVGDVDPLAHDFMLVAAFVGGAEIPGGDGPGIAGRRDTCAYTQVAGATNERQEFAQIVFADHTVDEVLRNETSCKQQGNVRTCNAKIITPPGNPRTIPAWYRAPPMRGATSTSMWARASTSPMGFWTDLLFWTDLF
ncbi:MAG: hypothetical protein ACKOPS_27765, partial [Cyanobium sp.]